MNWITYKSKPLIKKEDKKLICQNELHLTGILVQKDIVALDDVCVTKNVIADIYCAKSIVVCKDVQIIGNIYSKECVIEGNVNGDVFAYDMLEIKERAILCGDINTQKLNVSSMALLNGYITNISSKDSNRISSKIKLKMNKIKYLNKGKRSVTPEIREPNSFQNDSEELNVNSNTTERDFQSEKSNQTIVEKTNEPIGEEINKPTRIERNWKWW